MTVSNDARYVRQLEDARRALESKVLKLKDVIADQRPASALTPLEKKERVELLNSIDQDVLNLNVLNSGDMEGTQSILSVVLRLLFVISNNLNDLKLDLHELKKEMEE